MPRPETIKHKDIALAMNINQSTVSRALDPARRHLVSKATCEEVEAMAHKLGFRPNIHARRVRTSRSEAITLVLDDINAPHISYSDFNAYAARLMMSITQGVIDGATENEYDVKLLPLHSRMPMKQDFMLKRVGFPYSDGVIFHGFHHLSAVYYFISEHRIPCLMVHGGMPATSRMPVVETDLEPGFREAVNTLKAAGHRDIVFASVHAPGTGSRKQRWELYCQVMREAGLENHIRQLTISTALELRKQAEAFAAAREFSALICFNDAMADMWRREIEYLGLKAGLDLSIIGCDANPAYKGLASIRVPFYEMGKAAGTILVDAIKNNKHNDFPGCILKSSLQHGESI
ncbi:MAG: LacI family DNA-binding transcriptional regulator [Victivallales bacterium]|nr:LacI family DNA-binding transcriptional regulator [Victivallales bacterium]